MSSLIQRLLDRGAASPSAVPPVFSATPSGSPMAEFDQRLKGGHFPNLVSLALNEPSEGMTELDPPETRDHPVIHRATGPADIALREGVHPTQSETPEIEWHQDKRQRNALPPNSGTPNAEAQPPMPESPPYRNTAPAAPSRTQRLRKRLDRSEAAEKEISASVANVPEQPPTDMSPVLKQPAPPESVAQKPTPIGLGRRVVASPEHSEQPKEMPQARVRQTVETPAVPAEKISSTEYAEAKPISIRPSFAQPVIDPLPPPPAAQNAPTVPKRVVERIIREVPAEQTERATTRSEPATAESVSKIGPLPQRQRAFTLFGRRIR